MTRVYREEAILREIGGKTMGYRSIRTAELGTKSGQKGKQLEKLVEEGRVENSMLADSCV